MAVKLWTGTEWRNGTVKISPGGTAPLRNGEILRWPWVGGADLVGDLKPVAYGGNRGFGGNEWANNTVFAADSFFNEDRLALIKDRLVGAVDLRILSGTVGADKLVLSYESTVTYSGGTGTVATMTVADWATATIPSPTGGGTQPASFWDNSSTSNYAGRSIAPEWIGKQIIAPLIRDAAAVTPLCSWVQAHPGSEKQIIGSSDTYAHCQQMIASGMYAMQRWSTSTPTLANLQTAAADGMYGVLVSATYLTSAMITNAKANSLKIWVYNADSPELVASYTDMGVDGIYTTTPIAALTGTNPPPPPGNTKTIWGYGAESWGDVNGKMGGGLLAPRVVRSYTGTTTNGTIDIPNDLRGKKDAQGNYIVIWESAKPSMAVCKSAVEREAFAQRVVNYLTANIPVGQPVYITVWHEPEETSGTPAYDWRQHFTSTAAWQQAWRDIHTALYDKFVIARASGHKFYSTPLICDWTIWNTSKGSASSWYPLSWTTYDVMGWDIYATGQKTDATNSSICRLWCTADWTPRPYTYARDGQGVKAISTIASMAAARNKPWANGETGLVRGDSIIPPPGSDAMEYSSFYRYSGRQRAQRSYDMIQQVANLPNPPILWTWYDTTGCKVSGFPGDPAGSGGGDSWPAGLTIAAWNSTLTPSYNGVHP